MSFRSLIPSSCRKNAKQMQVDLLDGSANTFQTNVCSDYSVWIWTLVSRCCAHIAVLSGGLAHINQSVMRENSCECICNYSLINQMNSGCLTSNYPTRSLFQARKKKAKETITISVTIKKNAGQSADLTHRFSQQHRCFIKMSCRNNDPQELLQSFLKAQESKASPH